MRVSVPVAVWGADWAGFVPDWFSSIEQMTRKPDEIILGVTDPDETRATEYAAKCSVPVRIVTLEPGDFNDHWNAVFAACPDGWIAPCCIDDRFLPDALAEIDAAEAAGAELLVDGIVWKSHGGKWRGYWDAAAIGRVLTLPGAAPFRKSLYDRIGGFRSDIYSSDWAFYMDAAVAGVKVYEASTLRIVFDDGAQHSTRSGLRLDANTRAMADAQIRELAEQLGLR